MSLPEFRSETPTQFDLARWLFQKIETIEGPCKTRTDTLALMYECISAIRQPEKGSKS